MTNKIDRIHEKAEKLLELYEKTVDESEKRLPSAPCRSHKISGIHAVICSVLMQDSDDPWTGEGLPPVDTVCEHMKHPNLPWFECKVIAHFNDGKEEVAAFLVTDSTNFTVVGQGNSKEFRPILTPEQITVKARAQAAKDLYYTINWADDPTAWDRTSAARKADYFKAIDAGYRKIEGGDA